MSPNGLASSCACLALEKVRNQSLDGVSWMKRVQMLTYVPGFGNSILTDLFGRTQREEVLMPYLRSLSSFRDGVRRLAMAKGDTALKDILALCDKLRDSDLVPLGVALDDQEGSFGDCLSPERY
jgi:hypothetical protein